MVIPSDPTIYNFDRVLSLSHVCQRRMAILRDIHISGQDLAMVDAQIARTRKALLFVLIKVLPRCAARYSCYPLLQTNIKGAVNLILQRRDQVKRLEVRVDCQTLQQQLSCEWSNLKEFVWVDVSPRLKHPQN